MARPERLKIYAVIGLFAFLPLLQFSINDMREEIVPTKNVYLAVTPGEFAGTLLLGGFRGIAVDILWVRVQKLQREEKFFEIIPLSDMISKLQPHDRMVWEFISWNMAYNISIKFPNSREDRWKWVKSGIETNIKGIRRMPNNWKLYKHLAFMFSHKCGDYEEECLRDFGQDNDALAREYYRKVLNLNPDAPLYVQRAIIHTYEKQGEFEKALELYNKHLKIYPYDHIAKQNRDDFSKQKERYFHYVEEAKKAYKEREYEKIVEIYEDHIFGEPYLLPSDAIEVILFSYLYTEHFDMGIRFIHRRMNYKMDDKERIYALYEKYTEKYNSHYGKELKELYEKRDFEAVYNLFKGKFSEKKVDISLNNGIIVLEVLISTGRYKRAENLLVELQKWKSGSNELDRLKKVLQEKRIQNVEE